MAAALQGGCSSAVAAANALTMLWSVPAVPNDGADFRNTRQPVIVCHSSTTFGRILARRVLWIGQCGG